MHTPSLYQQTHSIWFKKLSINSPKFLKPSIHSIQVLILAFYSPLESDVLDFQPDPNLHPSLVRSLPCQTWKLVGILTMPLPLPLRQGWISMKQGVFNLNFKMNHVSCLQPNSKFPDPCNWSSQLAAQNNLLRGILSWAFLRAVLQPANWPW